MNGDNIRITSEQFHSILYLNRARASDAGNYTCVADGRGGRSYFSISALMPGKPDSLKSCKLTNVSTSDVMLKCFLGYDGGDELSFYTTAEHNGQVSDARMKATRDNATAFIHVMGLKPGKGYTLRVFAVNKFGRSDSPAVLSVTTDQDHSIDTSVGYYAGNTGVIIGGVVGGICFVAMLTTIAICAYLKYQKTHKDEDLQPFADDEILDFNESLTTNEINAKPEDANHYEDKSMENFHGKILRVEDGDDDDNDYNNYNHKSDISQDYHFSNDLISIERPRPKSHSKSQRHLENDTGKFDYRDKSDDDDDDDILSDFAKHRKSLSHHGRRGSGTGHNEKHASQHVSSFEIDTDIDQILPCDNYNQAPRRSRRNNTISVKNSQHNGEHSLGVIELHLDPMTHNNGRPVLISGDAQLFADVAELKPIPQIPLLLTIDESEAMSQSTSSNYTKDELDDSDFTVLFQPSRPTSQLVINGNCRPIDTFVSDTFDDDVNMITIDSELSGCLSSQKQLKCVTNRA